MGPRLPIRSVTYLLLLAAAWGCNGDAGTSKTKSNVGVWGRVTLDGAPVDEGFIEFEHSPGRWIQGSLSIAQGEYRGELPPGSYLVKIYASRLAKPGEPGYGPGGYLMYIPAQYNAKSKLKIEVPAGGGEFPFELTSKIPEKS